MAFDFAGIPGAPYQQACCKLGLMSPEYRQESLNPLIQPQVIIGLHEGLF